MEMKNKDSIDIDHSRFLKAIDKREISVRFAQKINKVQNDYFVRGKITEVEYNEKMVLLLEEWRQREEKKKK